MKFLMFNGIVAVALYYLVTGGFDNVPGIQVLQPVRTAVTGVLSDAGLPPRTATPAVVQAPAPTPAAAPPPVQTAAANPPPPAAAPLPVEEQAALPEVFVEAHPVPVAPHPVETAWIGTDAEERLTRGAEAVDEPAPAADGAEEKPTFMTPRERLAELRRLSEEMELFFVEKTIE